MPLWQAGRMPQEPSHGAMPSRISDGKDGSGPRSTRSPGAGGGCLLHGRLAYEPPGAISVAAAGLPIGGGRLPGHAPSSPRAGPAFGAAVVGRGLRRLCPSRRRQCVLHGRVFCHHRTSLHALHLFDLGTHDIVILGQASAALGAERAIGSPWARCHKTVIGRLRTSWGARAAPGPIPSLGRLPVET